jgi:hypothetical protein
MQKSTLTMINLLIAVSLSVFSSFSMAGGKTYTEDEFLDTFSGKSKKVVETKLGQPIKKQQAVKPTNAGTVIGKNVSDKGQKPVKVEMWYYKNIVKYDPKRTYKETEITFVNDKVMNIGFFNNR